MRRAARAVFAVSIAVCLAQGGAPAAQAAQFRTGPAVRVGEGETVDDDLYAASSRVAVDGRVGGDLVAAGGTVRVRGQVDGAVLAAGGAVVLFGPVGRTVRAVGGLVELHGAMGSDAVVAGGTVEVAPTARIGRDLVATGGNVTVEGTVGRRAVVGGGRVVIAGTVHGDVEVRGGEVVVTSGAVVRGSLTYTSDRPARIAPGARIEGAVTQVQMPARPAPPRTALRGLRVVLGVVDLVWMLALVLVSVAVFPRGLCTAARTLWERPWASLGWGLLLFAAIPVVSVLLFVMVLGVPVALLLGTAHLLALFASHATMAVALGQLVTGRRRSLYAQAAVGVVLVAVATALPYVGIVLRLLLVALGLGAVALAFWQGRAATASPPG